ncbi:uncharacterized protein LOC111062901 [Nilaparvata lugens]|uniref:uncharacterized protein LOC111062901 n=1 Tax=Nilaparvata lugens TaxID=108931 RepID=UPI00193D1E9B|nr:uncharacterized protein LOC111062901 [Nilaparvata lugens]
MSPWPENQNEPKAPDKNSDSDNVTVNSGSRTKIPNSDVTDSDIPDHIVPEEKLAETTTTGREKVMTCPKGHSLQNIVFESSNVESKQGQGISTKSSQDFGASSSKPVQKPQSVGTLTLVLGFPDGPRNTSKSSTGFLECASSSRSITVSHESTLPSKSYQGVQEFPSTSKSSQGTNSKLNQGVQPVDSLDEDGLKSLLEEAITYKSPKDKDTKSALFQNLLIEAEKNDDSDQTDDDSTSFKYQPLGLGRNRYGNPAPRKRLNRRDTDRQRGGGSLQNLSGGAKFGAVSARQREGGSLPTNVNQSMILDDSLCNFTTRATLQVSGGRPSPVDTPISIPITAAKVTSSVINGVEHVPLQLHSNYNAVKSVVGSETALKSGSSTENTTQHVSTCFVPISPQQSTITSLRDTDMRQFPTYITTSTGVESKKSLDENGNALGTTNKVETNTSERKTKRKKKNYRNIVNAENIEGHRWEEDIDSLMKYINSGSGTTEECKSQKSRQVRPTKSKEDEGRKRRAGKESERKIHKSNSMEEISKTKLEDLTSPSQKTTEENNTRVKPIKQVTLDDNELEASCRTVSVEQIQVIDHKKPLEKESSDLQDSEFHLVCKKKQRKKKRQANNFGRQGRGASHSGYCPHQGFPSHYRRSAKTIQDRIQPRRKSASSVPPSDKSDSSDLDSVHSLPVSSTTPKPTVGKTSTSGGSTPQASYADITRTMSIQVSSPPPAPPTPPPPPPPLPTTLSLSAPLRKDAMTDTDSDMLLLPVEEYPPLARKIATGEPIVRKTASGDLFVEFTFKRNRAATRDTDISLEETITVTKSSVVNKKDSIERVDSDARKEQSASSKAAADKRPPVILMNRSGRSSPKKTLDVTFGFDINRELLATPTKEPYDLEKTVNYVKSGKSSLFIILDLIKPRVVQCATYFIELTVVLVF